MKDHPHACGDKSLYLHFSRLSLGSSPRVWGQATGTFGVAPALGSSPRVWGQVIRTHTQYVFGGIIPTRVGTRNSVKNNSISEWGSSPRVWGQEIWHYLGSNFCRIIPTRVGTSGFFYNFSVFVKDHPHACGDKKNTLFVINSAGGSSPRVWGQEDKRV